jgi:probable phosphoglycerate mutase
MSRPALFFVRHGETDWNVEGRLQGQTERPLNERGRAQAAAVGRVLASLAAGARDLPHHASPMRRTVETMDLMRRSLGLPEGGYATDPRLKELSFGRWEGSTWPEIVAAEPDLAARRDADKWRFQPPGGESYAMLLERVEAWLAGLDGPSVVVSHGGVARVLMHALAGVDPLRAANADVHQGKVLMFEDGRYRWVG